MTRRSRVGDAFLLDLKIHTMSNGINLSDAAAHRLSAGGTAPLTIHEYATTGGVTLKFGDVYVNAPFDDWYCARSEALLDLDATGTFQVQWRSRSTACEVLDLPGYLDTANAHGQPVIQTTMSHTDRIRVSPISGCTLDCTFCDLPSVPYTRHSAEEMLASIDVAARDVSLPPHHVLISGGSPGPAHLDWFDDTVTTVIEECPLPTDVMMSPRAGDLSYLTRFVEAGIHGFSFNLEVFGDAPATRIMPRKHALSTPHFGRTVTEAVRLLGAGTGAVRSIVIVGLDDVDTTLAAIELIASLGADPVLSPFRPAQNTDLERWEPPPEEFLREVHDLALAVAERHGVRLGPRCIPCQHNTLVVPDGAGYWYSAQGVG